jgi:imidazole glycerol-phosphate synthase subunit HisH
MKRNYVAIIDHGMGNLHSILGACRYVGLEARITNDPATLSSASLAILPGVGAFGEAVNRLEKLGLKKAIREFIDTGKPFVGICLGMQLLFQESTEFGRYSGLGLIEGTVERFRFEKSNSDLRIPHMGWNKITFPSIDWKTSLLSENSSEDFMYFVHSYFVRPTRREVVLAETTYGSHKFCVAVQVNNITGFQFHPEKSGEKGLQIFHKMKTLI